MIPVIVGVAALVVGATVGFLVRANMAKSLARTPSRRRRASKLIEAEQKVLEADQEAATVLRKANEDAKADAAQIRREAEEDVKSRRDEIARLERRIRETRGRAPRADPQARHPQRRARRARRDAPRRPAPAGAGRRAARVAARTDRRHDLLARPGKSWSRHVVDDAKRSAMAQVREIEQHAREEGEERARKIVTIAIQRVASEQTAESTVSVFTLPSEDMKGRIIGREGRNIRAFEAATGRQHHHRRHARGGGARPASTRSGARPPG